MAQRVSSDSGGVTPMTISGRMALERERLIGMSSDERAWRKQWLKDLQLHNEPVVVPELENKFFNPIRRFYRMPLDRVESLLTPVLGADRAYVTRFMFAKVSMFVAFVYAATYYFKYNTNDWTRKGGWRVLRSRICSVPGQPDYPRPIQRTLPSDYASRNFKNAPI